MKTIRLTEHDPPTTWHLSKAELRYLLAAERAGVVSIGLGDPAQGTYSLRAGNTIGALSWPELELLIRPKVDLQNIFFLLGFRGGLATWGQDAFHYLRDRDFMRALAWAFDSELRRALRYGLARSYLNREESLATVRGRIDVAEQIRRWQGRPHPIACRYEEYTTDIQLNRAIKAAIRRLRGISGLGPGLERSLRQSGSAFTDVDDVEFSSGAVPELTFTRLNRQWESVWRLAAMILRQEAVRDETGTVVGTSFTVNMNKVFEKFVEEIVKEQALRAGFALEAGAGVALTRKVEMAPDLILTFNGRRVAVGDAKYIELDPAGWKHANMYQLLAYCVALGLQRGLLIYANYRHLETHRVVAAGIDLEVIGIEMTVPPDQLVLQARGAAGRLIAHARAESMVAA